MKSTVGRISESSTDIFLETNCIIDLEQETKKPLHAKLSEVNASLEEKALWDEFNDVGNEMILNKAGR